MWPELTRLGDLPVRSFGVLVALGFLIAAQLMWPRLLARYGDDPQRDPDRGLQVALWILVGLLVGGRLMFAAVEVGKVLLSGSEASEVGAALLARPWEALYVWNGGLVMYGGLAGALLFGVWGARRAGLSVGHGLDTGLTAGFLGQAVGRIGCLFVGDDHGSPVPAFAEGWPFPLTLRAPSLEFIASERSLFSPAVAGQVVWATQTWMSLGALALYFCGLRWLERRRYPGQVALQLLFTYALWRFTLEFFRGDAVRGLYVDGALSTSQLLSIPLAVCAGIALLRRKGDLA
ncbi:MAG: prolipoprotein diacylglyceryl transferase [Planctomycetota bacterium]|jgi:phosphatidylglycerol:prolipoprotein diacylglycerol transferase